MNLVSPSRPEGALPAYASAPAHWAPWSADPTTLAARHTPPRHAGVYNSVGHDGHVWAHRPRTP